MQPPLQGPRAGSRLPSESSRVGVGLCGEAQGAWPMVPKTNGKRTDRSPPGLAASPLCRPRRPPGWASFQAWQTFSVKSGGGAEQTPLAFRALGVSQAATRQEVLSMDARIWVLHSLFLHSKSLKSAVYFTRMARPKVKCSGATRGCRCPAHAGEAAAGRGCDNVPPQSPPATLGPSVPSEAAAHPVPGRGAGSGPRTGVAGAHEVQPVSPTCPPPRGRRRRKSLPV